MTPLPDKLRYLHETVNIPDDGLETRGLTKNSEAEEIVNQMKKKIAESNTPDTEEKSLFKSVLVFDGWDIDFEESGKKIQFLLSSRDTYWKERVEETRTTLLFIGEKVLKEMSEIYAVDIKYADKKQWLEPSEFERIFLHRFNEAGLEALDTLLDNLK